MKTLLEIQNEVAKEYRQELGRSILVWESLRDSVKVSLHDEVCSRAQLECARETLEEAAKRGLYFSETNKGLMTIDKETITCKSNIKLIQ